MKSYLKKLSILCISFALLMGPSAHLNAMTIQPTNQEETLFDRVAGSFTKLYYGQFDDMNGDDYTRIITTTGVTAGVCYGIYWYFFKEHKKPGKPVELNQATTSKTNRSLGNQVTLRQLRVAPQRGATCGYHALKNGYLVVNALHGYNANTLQRDLLDTRLANRLINQWQRFVQERRHVTNEAATGESLFDDEIDDLFRIECGFGPRVHTGRNYWNYGRTLQAQCSFSIFSEQYLARDGQRLLNDIRRRVNRFRGRYSHIFILNPGGHWYTVVLHKYANGKREYIVMDTGSLYARRAAGVRDLIKHIEGADVARRI